MRATHGPVSVQSDERDAPNAAHVTDGRDDPEVADVGPRRPRVGAGAGEVADVRHGVGDEDGEEEDEVSGGEGLQQRRRRPPRAVLEGAYGQRVGHAPAHAQPAPEHAPRHETKHPALHVHGHLLLPAHITSHHMSPVRPTTTHPSGARGRVDGARPGEPECIPAVERRAGSRRAGVRQRLLAYIRPISWPEKFSTTNCGRPLTSGH